MEFNRYYRKNVEGLCVGMYILSTGRLVLKKELFFCVGEYAEYGFDQQRLIWYVCRLRDMVFS